MYMHANIDRNANEQGKDGKIEKHQHNLGNTGHLYVSFMWGVHHPYDNDEIKRQGGSNLSFA